MDRIYLDNNATTRVDPLVVEAMLPFFTEQFGNPSSMHSFGDSVGRRIREARSQVQALLGAEFDHEIVFTSCGTESDNAAIMSALQSRPERREIITSAVEHPAVLSLCRHLEQREGYRLHVIPVDRKGRLDIDAFVAALSPKVAVASIMWANNETGTLFPVEQLANLAKAFDVIFHTDAVQAVGKVAMNLKDSQIDMVSLSGHKLHAPKGMGALFVRRGTRFFPLLRGGHQERERRAGTENTAGIVGLGKACELALAHMEDENTRVRALRDRMEKGILETVGNCFVTGDTSNRLPNTSNIAFEFIEGEAVLLLLNKAGIAASSGSACTSGSLEPSHVMRAMGVPFTAAHGSIRFSLSRDNTAAQIDRVLEVVPPIVDRLRDLSPFWSAGAPAASAFAPEYA
jgi:cysteine desulfurase